MLQLSYLIRIFPIQPHLAELTHMRKQYGFLMGYKLEVVKST